MQLSSLKGLGPKRLQALQKMNINSPEELIKLAPSDYMDMSRIVKIADMPDNGYALIFARINPLTEFFGTRYPSSCFLSLFPSDFFIS